MESDPQNLLFPVHYPDYSSLSHFKTSKISDVLSRGMGMAATTNPVMIDKTSHLLNDIETKEFVIKKVDKFVEENTISENVGKIQNTCFTKSKVI